MPANPIYAPINPAITSKFSISGCFPPQTHLQDDRFAYGEQRFITLGLLKQTLVAIAHTEYNNEIRVISMRRGTKREQLIFFQNLSN